MNNVMRAIAKEIIERASRPARVWLLSLGMAPQTFVVPDWDGNVPEIVSEIFPDGETTKWLKENALGILLGTADPLWVATWSTVVGRPLPPFRETPEVHRGDIVVTPACGGYRFWKIKD